MLSTRSLLLIFATFSVAYTKPAEGDEGRYYSDDSGKYIHNPNDGRYIPDYSGQYNPDFSGNYKHDGLGGYRGDGSGRYSGQKDSQFRSSKFGSSNFGNLVGANTFQAPQTIVKPAANFGNTPSAANNIQRGSFATGSGRYNDEGKWKIIRQVGDVDLDGYHWEYLTENGINAEESGKLVNQNTDNELMRAKGFFTYTGPDNVVYHISYTADENGFVAQGDHIPTPPPIPDAILKSLNYQRSIGELKK